MKQSKATGRGRNEVTTTPSVSHLCPARPIFPALHDAAHSEDAQDSLVYLRLYFFSQPQLQRQRQHWQAHTELLFGTRSLAPSYLVKDSEGYCAQDRIWKKRPLSNQRWVSMWER